MQENSDFHKMSIFSQLHSIPFYKHGEYLNTLAGYYET